MRKLLSANVNRLWINRTFWLSVIVMICIQAVSSFMLRRNSMPMDAVLFVSLQCISIVVAIFLSLFLGTEYSDKTMRNKLAVGHKRSNLYLANLITGIIAVTIIYLAAILTGIITGLLLYDAPQNSIGQIVLAGVVGWLACSSFVSMFNLIGMVSGSKSLTAIICLLSAFALIFAGLYTFQSLSRPDHLSGVTRAFYQTFFELNPYGQILQTMTIAIASPLKLISYSLALSFILTCMGLCVFCKKDLK